MTPPNLLAEGEREEKKIHRHRWQFARYTPVFEMSNGLKLKAFLMFVCECGLSQIKGLKGE